MNGYLFIFIYPHAHIVTECDTRSRFNVGVPMENCSESLGTFLLFADASRQSPSAPFQRRGTACEDDLLGLKLNFNFKLPRFQVMSPGTRWMWFNKRSKLYFKIKYIFLQFYVICRLTATKKKMFFLLKIQFFFLFVFFCSCLHKIVTIINYLIY